MLIDPEKIGTGIVLVGNFNPLIFRPEWFGTNNIIREKEAAAAEIGVIHAEIVVFSLDWVKVQVQQDRFAANTTEDDDPRIWDLVVKTFKEFLSHTPITKMGVNYTVDFRTKNLETMNKVGETLAPKESWGEWSEKLLRREGDVFSGMRTLTMQQSTRDDGWKGHIQAKVEPSVLIAPDPGIQVAINDHIEIDEPEKVQGCLEIISKLEADCESAIMNSKWIVNQVMELANK